MTDSCYPVVFEPRGETFILDLYILLVVVITIVVWTRKTTSLNNFDEHMASLLPDVLALVLPWFGDCDRSVLALAHTHQLIYCHSWIWIYVCEIYGAYIDRVPHDRRVHRRAVRLYQDVRRALG